MQWFINECLVMFKKTLDGMGNSQIFKTITKTINNLMSDEFFNRLK